MIEAGEHLALALEGTDAVLGALDGLVKLMQPLANLRQAQIAGAGDVQRFGEQLDTRVALVRGIGALNGALQLLGDGVQAF